MPGPVSDSYQGPPEDGPYVRHVYATARRVSCGHHEGYHNDAGQCMQPLAAAVRELPDDCLTP